MTVDTSITANADALVERIDERFIFLNVWSQVRGQEEVLSIIGEIDRLMHNNKLELDDGYVVSIQVDRKMTRRDADNVTFQGQVTLRVLTHH